MKPYFWPSLSSLTSFVTQWYHYLNSKTKSQNIHEFYWVPSFLYRPVRGVLSLCRPYGWEHKAPESLSKLCMFAQMESNRSLSDLWFSKLMLLTKHLYNSLYSHVIHFTPKETTAKPYWVHLMSYAICICYCCMHFLQQPCGVGSVILCSLSLQMTFKHILSSYPKVKQPGNAKARIKPTSLTPGCPLPLTSSLVAFLRAWTIFHGSMTSF